MNPQSNPDERFHEMDRLDRAERAIQQTAETMLTLAESQKRTGEKLGGVADKLDALTDIVRSWYERHGNGSAGH
ncbi:MAG TPA: hypothetical protein VK724_05660 [Bryobacteraceae bacterium]|nr:hypothetical protein [Bryobacteraceae bacterium]